MSQAPGSHTAAPHTAALHTAAPHASATALRTLEEAVEEFAKATRFPLAFGGYKSGGIAQVTALSGNRTLSLQGLRVAAGRGLGGRAMHERRPRMTVDYSRSPHITHDYDGEVLAESVRVLFAMPVLLDGEVRAVLYGGTRGGPSPGTAFVQAGASVARALAQEIRVEDEVTRRIAARAAVPGASAAQPPDREELPSALREELRSGHAELRRLAAACQDPELREQLQTLERRLARIGSAEHADDCTSEVRLTPRELDVLSHAALGWKNAEIGASLALTESTVKSYLKSAMSKLGASSRHAAVAEARRSWLIP